jgi:hypothetical protein
MYGLTRGTTTLLGAAIAGLLIWISTQINPFHTGGYWGMMGLLAAAGLVMALSQLLGGWTKWGWPRVSGSVFLVGFLPVLVCAGWVILAGQPSGNWFQRHVFSWSGSIGIRGLVTDLFQFIPVLAFGLGLVFGFIFDTTGPRTEPILRRRRMPIPTTATQTPPSAPADADAGAEERPAAREAGTPVAPQPEPEPEETTPPPG